MEDKIITDWDYAANLIYNFRSINKEIVFTNGVFDIIHPGHVAYLQQARELGDVLVVGVNTDESVRQFKDPRRPINTLKQRMTVLAGLSMVSYVVPFGEPTAVEIIGALKPTVYVKGGDYKEEDIPEAATVRQLEGTVKILPYNSEFSTTQIINTILQKYSNAQPVEQTQ